MAKRTQFYQKLPWTGGVNDSVDPGVLTDNDLVRADNVVFATSGSRLKREGLSYLDTTMPEPDLRSSSSTTRTLKFTTNSIKKTSGGSADQLLVSGEYVTVSGVSNYAATNVEITVSHTAQVATIQTVAKSSVPAASYFLLDAAEGGTDYYVWMDTTGSDVDPAISGRTGVQVDISGDTTANDVASTLNTAIDALSDFSSTVSTDTVTVTWAETGVAIDPTDPGSTGFTLNVTTQGSSQFTYTGSSSLTESETAAGEITVARAESVLCLADYWRTDSSNVQQQELISCTNKLNLFKYNSSNLRQVITGQEETTEITCVAQASILDGEYVTLYTANDETQYTFWFDQSGSGSAPGGQPNPQEVDISGDTTDEEVAATLAGVIDGITGFSASASGAVVTVVNDSAGETTDATESVSNVGFTVEVTLQGASKPSTDVEIVRSIVFNNRLILCFNDVGVLPIYYRPESSSKYQKLLNAPDAGFMTSYLSRLWCNDKTDPHRIHYSTTGEHEEWNGAGDSGAIDIDPGDGDAEGITNLFTYKGALFVQKKNKYYRILGDAPENFQVVPLSKGIGSEGSLAINIDQDDVVFVSKRGFHSAQATDQFGDVSSRFLSAKLQNTFNTWPPSRLKYIQGAWLPELNSIVFGVTATGSQNNEVWLYNVEQQAWYRWPSISCQAVGARLSGNVTKPVFGTNDGRVIQAQNGDFADFGTTAYTYRVKTGRIYPGGNPTSTKAFKRIGFIYKPIGDFSFSVRVKIDNGATQAFTFSQESTTEKLGVDFILGQSVLGFDSVLSPYFSTVDGYGRGLTLEIEQTSLDQQVEIYGFIVEYEEEGFRQEVKTD